MKANLKIDYYISLLSQLKSKFPTVHLQAFTAVEIAHFAEVSRLSIKETLLKLKNAGLGSMPGGGAEIFNPKIRDIICPEKIPGDKWLDIMKTAHNLGIKSNATMLYGHVETPEDVIDRSVLPRLGRCEPKPPLGHPLGAGQRMGRPHYVGSPRTHRLHVSGFHGH